MLVLSRFLVSSWKQYLLHWFFFFCPFIFIFIFLILTATRLDVCSGIMEKFRIFRTEKTYAVKAGKWYFEFEAVTAGDMRVGWTRPGCLPDQELGSDEEAFVFDGFKVCMCLSVIIWVAAKILIFLSCSMYHCLRCLLCFHLMFHESISLFLRA